MQYTRELLFIVDNGRSYFLGNKRMTFAHAAQDCVSRKMELVRVDSLSENGFLQREAAKLSLSNYGPWIGLHQMRAGGQWRWQDSCVARWTNWAPHEPNNAGSRGEDCAHFFNVNSGQWNDLHCSNLLPYICEERSNLQCPTPLPPTFHTTTIPAWGFHTKCKCK